jgi:orotate phosphoribosyltransferase
MVCSDFFNFRVVGMTPERSDLAKGRLCAIIAERSLLRGGSVTLASGALSKYYFDMKPTLFHARALNLIADLMLAEIRALKPACEYVGGMELGGVPLVAAVVQKSAAGAALAGFFVRKLPKDHGTKRLVEGLAPGQSLAGENVVLVEDVTTTGGSIMKAVAAVRAEGGTVGRVITVVDRLEGAAGNLAREGISLSALTTRDDYTL